MESRQGRGAHHHSRVLPTRSTSARPSIPKCPSSILIRSAPTSRRSSRAKHTAHTPRRQRGAGTRHTNLQGSPPEHRSLRCWASPICHRVSNCGTAEYPSGSEGESAHRSGPAAAASQLRSAETKQHASYIQRAGQTPHTWGWRAVSKTGRRARSQSACALVSGRRGA